MDKQGNIKYLGEIDSVQTILKSFCFTLYEGTQDLLEALSKDL